jgi:hypothetical protein
MVQTVLVGSALFGLLLVGVAGYLSRHEWRGYSPLIQRSGRSSMAERALSHPATWTAVFLLAVVGFGVAVVATVSGDIGAATQQLAVLLLAAGTGLGLVFYLFYGTFVSARNRGLESSQAAALGSWAIGLLFIVVVALKLAGMF